MPKQTTQQQLDNHEVLCQERHRTIDNRLGRLENQMDKIHIWQIGTLGAVVLSAIISKLL